jgi:hypothetical protein
MSQTTKRNVQPIGEGEGKWVYIGTGFQKPNGTVTIMLDPDKSAPAGARLFLSKRREKTQQEG